MTTLLHFEDKVHRKGLARADSLPLLMSQLLSQILEHLGFPEEPRIERRIRCPRVLTMERAMVMPISFLLQQQAQEEVADEEVEDSQRRDDPVPEVEAEVARSPVPDLSPPSTPPPPSTTASAYTPGPSYTAQHSPEYVHVSSRELACVLDAVCSLTTTQASMDQRLTRAETTLEHCHTMLLQIMSHLGLSHVPAHRDEPTAAAAAAASLDLLATAAAASDPPPPRE